MFTTTTNTTGARSMRSRVGRWAVLSAVAAGLAATTACGATGQDTSGGAAAAPKPLSEQEKAQQAVDRYTEAFNSFVSSGGQKIGQMDLHSRDDVAKAFDGLACDGFVAKAQLNFDQFAERRTVEPNIQAPVWHKVTKSKLSFAPPVLQGDHGRAESTLHQPGKDDLHGYINLNKLPSGQWQICPAGS